MTVIDDIRTTDGLTPASEVDIPAHSIGPKTSRRRAILTGGIGNAIEFFDWSIYAFLAPFIAVAIFPSSSPLAGLLATFAIFASGFLARPIGGYFLGKTADRRGRKYALTLSVVVMCLASVAIALTPSAAMIGGGAAIILAVCRLVQGFSLGGELPSAISYMVGQAPRNRTGRFVSFYTLGATVGALVGALVCLALTMGLSDAAMNSWGWRVPFLIAGGLAIVAYFIRRNAPEEVPTKTKSSQRPVKALWRYHHPIVLMIAAAAAVYSTLYVTLITTFPSVATQLGASKETAFLALVVGQIACLGIVPLSGILCDKIGAKTVLIGSSILTGLVVAPILVWLAASPGSVVIICALSMIPVSAVGVSTFAYLVPRLPHDLRGAGLGTAYTIPACLFGGTAPLLVTALVGIGLVPYFGIFVLLLCTCSLATIFIYGSRTRTYPSEVAD